MFAAAMLAVCAMGAGCGDDGGPNADGENDGGTDGGGENPAADEACDAYFDAHTSPASLAPTLGPSGWPPVIRIDATKLTLPAERERARRRYRDDCAARLALPGGGFTIASAKACADAIESGDSEEATREACTFPGTLSAGSSCAIAEQCESGDCFILSYCAVPPRVPPGMLNAGVTAASCGVCREAETAGIGEACGSDPPCGRDAVCIYPSTLARLPTTGTCIAIDHVAEGDPCGKLAAVCEAGLECAPSADGIAVCSAPGDESDECFGPGTCKPPLICPSKTSDAPVACQKRGASGTSCLNDYECGEGLLCAHSLDGSNRTTAKCAKATFGEPGDECGSAARCRVGHCGPSGTCPEVIGDGEPCSKFMMEPSAFGGVDGVCDVLATCDDGVCARTSYAKCDAKPVEGDPPLVCPPPLVVECPTAAPTNRVTCDVPEPAEGQFVLAPYGCEYDGGATRCSCGYHDASGDREWRCDTCPTTQPGAGDACYPLPLFDLCAYGDTQCSCSLFRWTCGTCPSNAPETGSACDVSLMACDYRGTSCKCLDYGDAEQPPGASGSAPASNVAWSCRCDADSIACVDCVLASCGVQHSACEADTTCGSAREAVTACLCEAQTQGAPVAPCITAFQADGGMLAEDHSSCTMDHCATECGLD